MLVKLAQGLVTLAARYRFSVTSWIRSPKHNEAVGGHVNSRHMLGLAVDLELDSGENQSSFIADAKRLGFVVVLEDDHIHLQF